MNLPGDGGKNGGVRQQEDERVRVIVNSYDGTRTGAGR